MNKKLLLIESDPFYVEIIGVFVRLFLQYDFEVPNTDSDLVVVVQKAHPNIIMVDLDKKPNMIEIVRSIKNNPSLSPVPVLSIAQDHSLERSVLVAGSDRFLVKPFKVCDMEAMIHALVA